jgi:aminopeptidase N
MLRFLVQLFISALLLAGCRGTGNLSGTADMHTAVTGPDTAQSDLGEITVTSPWQYQGSDTMHYDLMHTKLELSFDFAQEFVFGRATLEVSPWFYPMDNLVLDAKGFDLHSIRLLKGDTALVLDYAYNRRQIDIALDKTYRKGDKLLIEIQYTAKPAELEPILGDAIASDQGLYFVNPKNLDTNKPTQIWTQGETTSNSNWFPTIDAPNQRCTQEMYITVPAGYTTLSNGTHIYSQINPDSTRTDYWKMDLPHAPYLFMLAIGNFAVVEDEWNGLKMQYYVEPEYAPHAHSIFGRTPEMMTFFSDLFGYPYPWSKYAQVVVRDFVTGAMENTTASVFMEEVQSTTRELIDYNWDDIIAHELCHQWFGNLVTCESWANVTLNEAFATYGEVLWADYYEGEQAAQYKLYTDKRNYLDESRSKKVDLIRYYHDDPDDLFDHHSYAKGGLILHLLRSYIGDEAFFSGLRYYLKINAFRSVEVHDLRLAFEYVTGMDLNWFFNQWFLDSGHPALHLQHRYVDSTGVLHIAVRQTQDSENHPVYRLPLQMDIWYAGKKVTHHMLVDAAYAHTEIPLPQPPDLIVPDNSFNLIVDLQQEMGPEAYRQLYQGYADVRPRIEAVKYFMDNWHTAEARETLKAALQDPFWRVRQLALLGIDNDTTMMASALYPMVLDLVEDPHSGVRSDAIAVLGNHDKVGHREVFRGALKDSSYIVLGTALDYYIQSDAEDLPGVVRDFEDLDNINIVLPIADYYLQTDNYDKYGWYVQKIDNIHGANLWYLVRLFGLYLLDAPGDVLEKGIDKLHSLGLQNPSHYVRISAYQSLELLSDKEGVPDILATLREQEKDPRVVEFFDN